MLKKYDLSGKRVGKLTIKTLVPKDKRPTNTHGNYWYCDCDCGTKNIKVPTSYLTGNGNYTQRSCGCDRKIAAFIKTSRKDLSMEYLSHFDNFEKFLLIHKAFVRTTNIDIINLPLQEYKEYIEYFYYNKQFNVVYDFWKKNKIISNTYYDWAKPSLDHIIPKSKGGTETLNNLQFLTLFENLCKKDLTQQEWDSFKKSTNTTSDYFIEKILEKGEGEYTI